MKVNLAGSKTMYKFKEQLELGQQHEKEIFDYLEEDGWIVKTATREYQRRGIDCFVTKDKITYSIEIKSDSRASKTGNAFVETVSVDNPFKRGWAYTSQSNFIFYYLPLDCLIYCLNTQWIKCSVNIWEKRFPKRTIPNKNYNTIGLLIPLYFFEEIAQKDKQKIVVINM